MIVANCAGLRLLVNTLASQMTTRRTRRAKPTTTANCSKQAITRADRTIPDCRCRSATPAAGGDNPSHRPAEAAGLQQWGPESSHHSPAEHLYCASSRVPPQPSCRRLASMDSDGS